MAVITLGFDVSAAQGQIDWPVLRGSPRRFVWAKATEGPRFVDPTFARNAAGAQSIGMADGGYEFAHLDADPAACATHTCGVILANGFSDRSLPPALDVERLAGSPHGAAVEDWINTWADVCERLTGRTPVVYTGAGYWSHPSVGNPPAPSLARFPLWLAAYVEDPSKFVPQPWRAVGFAVHQETGDQAPPGKTILCLPGIRGNVDSDVMPGVVEDFIARSFVRQTKPDGGWQPGRPNDSAHDPYWVDRLEAAWDPDKTPTEPAIARSRSSQRMRAVVAPILGVDDGHATDPAPPPVDPDPEPPEAA